MTDGDKEELTNLIIDSGLKSGYSLVPSNTNIGAYYKVKEGEGGYVVGYVAQYVVLLKRMAHLQQLGKYSSFAFWLVSPRSIVR